MARSQLRLYIAVSLDGYIATPDGSVEWLSPYPAEDFGYNEFFAEIDTIVMGRATYDQTLTFGAWPYAGNRVIVLTSRTIAQPPAGVEAHSGDIRPLAKRLRGGERDTWLAGGAKAVRPFLEHDFVDEIELYVVPLLLGDGIPLFAKGQPKQLQFVASRMLRKGVMKLIYRPASAD